MAKLFSLAIWTILIIVLLSPHSSTNNHNSLLVNAEESAVEIDDTETNEKCDPSTNKCNSEAGTPNEEEADGNISVEGDEEDEEDDDVDDLGTSDDDDEDEDEEEDEEKKPDGPAVIDPEGKENDDSYAIPESSTKAIFFESFQDKSIPQWKYSKDESYNGQFSIGQGKEPTLPGDRALIITQKARKYGISASFNELSGNSPDTLVLQYEVKLEEGHTCGGAYVKIPLPDFDQDSYNGDTPYSIMFGPDKCGGTNKVHFIFQSENDGKRKEHHLINPPSVPSAAILVTTHLYTLIIKNKSEFEVLIDNESKANGTLFDKFEPSLQSNEMIPDPNEKKPADWVDVKQMPDADAVKPEDWDEDLPKEIEDKDAKKPDDWLENEVVQIADPEAKQPDDWDSEEDGEWEIPLMDNPKCSEISGCGEWKRPMIKNPDYKGKWSPPLIDNPKYIGEWKPTEIKNPDYYEVDTDHTGVLGIGGVGFELWTMDQGVLFDNIWIGDDIDALRKFTEESWGVKNEVEKKNEIARQAELAKKQKEAKEESENEGEEEDGDYDDDDDADDDDGEEYSEENKGDEKDEL